MARRARVGRDEEQVQRRRDRRVARHEDHCRIVQERGVQRREQVVVEAAWRPRWACDEARVPMAVARVPTTTPAPAVPAAPTLQSSRRMDAVDEDEARRRFVDPEALDVRGLQRGRRAAG